MMGAADLDDILHQRLGNGVLNHICDQAAVHFNSVELYIGEQRQIGVLGPEIVQAQPQTAGVEPVHNLPECGAA